MSRTHTERREMGDELRRLVDLLERENHEASAGECNPPVDVTETSTAIEIVMDLPGVPLEQVHLVFSRGSILIAGTKRPVACGHADATFHLAERAFGRFARVVRIAGAVDAGRARATLAAGELRVVVPRIEDRRGREIRIPIEIH